MLIPPLIALVLAAALTLGGCDKGKKTGAAAGSAGSAGSSAGSATTPQAAAVKVIVGDQPVATITSDVVATWPRLDQLIPAGARRLGTWQTVKLTGASGKVFEVSQPSASYPQFVPALFPDGKGGAAFGMFDPVELAKKGKPGVREDGVVEIRIMLVMGAGRGENDHGEGGVADPTTLKLTVKDVKGTIGTVDGTKLLALPREREPGQTDGEPKGWKLTTILAGTSAGKYERLLLTDAKGVNLTLEKQDLDPATSIPFVKLNRQGVLRFRVYKKQGETWQPTMDLRGLAAIEVLK